MISIPTKSKLFKTGPVSTAVVLPKDWVDKVKATLGTEDIHVRTFGEEFLVVEVEGLVIKNEKVSKLLKQIKEQFSVE